MDGDGKGLEESGRLIGDVVGNLVAPRRGVVDSLLQCALVVRNTLSAGPELHLLAEVVSTLAADGALSTRDANFESNTIAELEAGDEGPDGDDLARGLVAERERVAGAEVSIGELLVVADVGAADAGSLDRDLQLAGARLFNGSLLLDMSLDLTSQGGAREDDRRRDAT